MVGCGLSRRASGKCGIRTEKVFGGQSGINLAVDLRDLSREHREEEAERERLGVDTNKRQY